MAGKKKSAGKRGRKASDSQDLPSSKKLKVNNSNCDVTKPLVKTKPTEESSVCVNKSPVSVKSIHSCSVTNEKYTSTASQTPTPPLTYESDDELVISQEISERASQIVDSIMQLVNEEDSCDNEALQGTSKILNDSVSSAACLSTPKAAVPLHVKQKHGDNQCSTPLSDHLQCKNLDKLSIERNATAEPLKNTTLSNTVPPSKSNTKSVSNKLLSGKNTKKKANSRFKGRKTSSSTRLTRQTHIPVDEQSYPLSVTVTTPIREVHHMQKLTESKFYIENAIPIESYSNVTQDVRNEEEFPATFSKKKKYICDSLISQNHFDDQNESDELTACPSKPKSEIVKVTTGFGGGYVHLAGRYRSGRISASAHVVHRNHRPPAFDAAGSTHFGLAGLNPELGQINARGLDARSRVARRYRHRPLVE